ncbi:hypothetical protein O181_072025 [Austropuccinia psidii MF-1]|uniref:Uncharacterized protein n=1 Tax=Austropuccinia psidii MF-1 TaxID=1389203 RepID=A0A9Q3F7V1_9BASI|nr:hypothetical protein [Austropuccinia psidii MF-1]
MASSGHFDPSQTYDGYKAVEVLDPAFTEFLKKGEQLFQPYNPWSSQCHHFFIGKKPCKCLGAPISNIQWYLWSRKDGSFGRNFPVSEAPTPNATSGKRDVARWTNVGGPIPIDGRPIYSSSEVPISRINSQGVVNIVRIVSDSPTDPNAEGSDELDGEDVEVVPNSIGHQSVLHLPTCFQKISKPSNTKYLQKNPTSPFHYSIFYSSSFTKSFHFQACAGFTSEAITRPTSQEFTNGHLPNLTTCGQLQKEKRRLISFTISFCPIISAKGALAYPGYQRRIKYDTECPYC